MTESITTSACGCETKIVVEDGPKYGAVTVKTTHTYCLPHSIGPQALAVLKRFVETNKRHGYEFDTNEPDLYAEMANLLAATATP